MLRYPFYLAASLLLLGCSASTPSVHEYTFLSPQSDYSKRTPLSTTTLSVAPSKSIGSLLGKSLLYCRENGETGAYLYSRWSDTPSALIQHSLLASLTDAAVFASLSSSTSLAHVDWVLESDLNAFCHRFSESMSEGYIDITYRLVDTRTKRLRSSKRFTISSPAPSMDAQGGVEALKNATRELNSQSIAWLTTLIKENQ